MRVFEFGLWEVEDIDRCHRCRRLADGFSTGYERLPTENRFDVIILNHVLEHLSNPLEKLSSLRQLLTPDGIVYLGVPHMDVFGYWQLQNAHLYYFTRRTLVHYAAKAGLSPLHVGTALGIHMYGVFRFDEEAVAPSLRNEAASIRRSWKRARRRRGLKRLLSQVGLFGIAKRAAASFGRPR